MSGLANQQTLTDYRVVIGKWSILAQAYAEVMIGS
jgi:hypothetical protein